MMLQCRKYKASEKVRQKAEFLYSKFKTLVHGGEGDHLPEVDLSAVVLLLTWIYACCCYNIDNLIVADTVFALL